MSAICEHSIRNVSMINLVRRTAFSEVIVLTPWESICIRGLYVAVKPIMLPVQKSDKFLKRRSGFDRRTIFARDEDTTRYSKVLRMQWVRYHGRPNIELHFEYFMAIYNVSFAADT